MFLSRKELQDLTGFRMYGKQAQWLSDNGYVFDIRSDGRPNVLMQQLVERQCKNTESKPVPNLAYLDQAS